VSTPILVIGKSGSGKSSSLKNLPPASTFLINVIGKELPFRGATKNFTEMKDGKGNKFTTDDYGKINATLTYIDSKRPEIKVVVIDDSQYLLVNEFMRKHSSHGKGNEIFALYNDIGDHFWKLIWDMRLLRQDLFVVLLHHTETGEGGEVKAKTIGKMLDEKVDIPGMFSICLHCVTSGEEHFFETTNKGNTPAKTPPDMFDAPRIPNDLNVVIEAITKYTKGE